MSKELKAPDKVTQKMTRDGAIAENLTTGETTSISERPPEENYSAPVAGAAEKTTNVSAQRLAATLKRARRKRPLTQHSLKPIRPACSFPKRNGQLRTCKRQSKNPIRRLTV